MNANPTSSNEARKSNKKPLSDKFRFLYELDLEEDVTNRLSVYLNNVLKGNSTSIVTPIAKDIDPNSILAEWDSFFEANKYKLNSTLIDLEYSNRSKFGPRSIAKPWKDRVSDVKSYFSNKQCRFNSPKFNMKKGFLRPIRISKAVNYLKNSTSAGLPDYVKKKVVKNSLVENFDDLLSRQDPCILFTRTQEGNKTRTVWGFPVVDTLNETMYYQPLLVHQKGLVWRSALLGPEYVDKAISTLIAKAKQADLLLVSVDFSTFDASVSKKLINSAFGYIKSLFQSSYHVQLEYIKNRFINIGILTPYGVYTGDHGVPSGSTFTNEVDSIVQYLVAKSSKVISSDELIQVQGDDGAVAIKESDYERLKQAFIDAGLVFNSSKSYKSKDFIIYLQNLYHCDYADESGNIGGIYPIYRALTRLCFQERWTNFEDYELEGRDYYSLRSLSILENCKNHPLFREFVEFIKSKDKYSLTFSSKSVHKYSELVNNGPGTGGILNHHYGSDIKGIKSFESYKIANGLK